MIRVISDPADPDPDHPKGTHRKTVSRDLFGHASRIPSWRPTQIEMTGDKSAF